jgi:hypothetical protein
MRRQTASLSRGHRPTRSIVRRVDETIEIFCDGQRVPLGYAYSIELGFVDSFIEDPSSGGLQRDGLVGNLKMKRLYGKIEARPND